MLMQIARGAAHGHQARQLGHGPSLRRHQGRRTRHHHRHAVGPGADGCAEGIVSSKRPHNQPSRVVQTSALISQGSSGGGLFDGGAAICSASPLSTSGPYRTRTSPSLPRNTRKSVKNRPTPASLPGGVRPRRKVRRGMPGSQRIGAGRSDVVLRQAPGRRVPPPCPSARGRKNWRKATGWPRNSALVAVVATAAAAS